LTPIVLDASAGVELALQTPIGRQLQVKLPVGAVSWVPEHYFVEAAAVLRRLELRGTYDEARVQLAMDRLLAAPVRRVSVRPLVAEGWQLRHNLTVADALYVVVAKHLNAPLVTTDNKLAAAPTLPVATITP
jgi:predicted nucleic acid-binding protein